LPRRCGWCAWNGCGWRREAHQRRTGGGAGAPDREDDASLLLSRLDVPVRLGDLLERVPTVDDRCNVPASHDYSRPVDIPGLAQLLRIDRCLRRAGGSRQHGPSVAGRHCAGSDRM
jgi:hypothetical protein